MEFNNGRERKQFESKWAKLRREYRNAGMSEEDIQDLYLLDLDEFKSSRSIAMWEQPLEDDMGEGSDCSLLRKSISQLSTNDAYFAEADRFSWMEQISDEALYTKLQSLSEEDKELLTLSAFDGYSQTEIGRMRNRTPSAICRKLERLGEFLFCK